MSRFERANAIHKAGLKRVKETPVPEGQKFIPGSYVKIARNLDKCDYAQVHHTYAHAFGGSNIKIYYLLIRYSADKWGAVAWYDEHQLEQIKDPSLINQFEQELEGVK